MRQNSWLLFLVSFLVSASSVTYADGPKIWIENDGGLSRDYLTNGKVKVAQGFFGGYDLEDLVKDSPTALDFTRKQAQFNTYAHLSYWIGVIPSSGFFGYGIGSRDTTMTLVSAATLLGTALLTGYFTSESRHYMYEAINTYNGVRHQTESEAHPISRSQFSSCQPSLAFNAVSISFSF